MQMRTHAGGDKHIGIHMFYLAPTPFSFLIIHTTPFLDILSLEKSLSYAETVDNSFIYACTCDLVTCVLPHKLNAIPVIKDNHF
jgi:hypothetical protein